MILKRDFTETSLSPLESSLDKLSSTFTVSAELVFSKNDLSGAYSVRSKQTGELVHHGMYTVARKKYGCYKGCVDFDGADYRL